MSITNANKTRRKTSVANFVEAVIDSSDKSQYQIAEEVGFNNSGMVSMIKHGKAKIPLDKARVLAKSIGIDQKDFFYRCFEEYYPAIYKEVEELRGEQLIYSDNERDIINRIRSARPDNPGIKTQEQEDAFNKFLATLIGE